MSEDFAALTARIPALQGWSGTALRLGGLTNRVWQLGDAIVRIPGDGTEAYIDRANEAVAARAAAAAGVSPEVLYFEDESGVMVTRLVPDALTMTPEAFANRSGAVERAAHALRRLHTSNQVFPARFDLFSMIEDYLSLLAGKDVALPEGYHDVVAEAGAIKAALARHPVALVPCHCDPLCENFLDTGDRMWIVDWEYSGMNDPMWDLGDFSVEAGLTEAQEAALMLAYFGTPPRSEDHARMVIYKAMCDLLWTLWGLIQLANDNPADDFRTYAEGRFTRCRRLMQSPSFARHLAVLER